MVLLIGVISGLLGGLLAGGGVMTIFSSGTKAILMCWAEEPNRLHEEHEFEDLHTESWICRDHMYMSRVFLPLISH